MLFVVDAFHVSIIPQLAPTQRRMAVTLQADAMNALLGEQITFGRTPLDENIFKVTFQENVLPLFLGINIQRNLNALGFAIGIGREINHLRTWSAQRQVVFAIARHGRHVETLHIVKTLFAIAINHIIDGAFVVFLEHLQPNNAFAHKNLVGHLQHLIFSVTIEDNHIVNIRTVAHKLVLLQPRSNEAFLAIDVEFLIGFYHFGAVDGVETADFRATRMRFSVFF